MGFSLIAGLRAMAQSDCRTACTRAMGMNARGSAMYLGWGCKDDDIIDHGLMDKRSQTMRLLSWVHGLWVGL